MIKETLITNPQKIGENSNLRKEIEELKQNAELRLRIYKNENRNKENKTKR